MIGFVATKVSNSDPLADSLPIRFGYVLQRPRSYSFMGIDHNLVVSCLGYSIEVVIYHPLTIVVLAAGNYIAYITTFTAL